MKLDKSVQITLVIVAGVLILGIMGYVLIAQLNPSYSNTISVNGEALIKAVPDLVGIYFNVETEGSTSSEATEENAEIVGKLKTSLISKGFDESEIQTQNFNVYPNYEWINGRQVERGYKATHSIKVELLTEESEKIGEIIDSGVNAGADVSYINFELSQSLQNQYKAEAIKQASEDARIKAEALAEGLWQELGKLVSVSDSSFDYYPWRVFSAGADSAASAEEAKQTATSIAPGEQEIFARVSAVFRLR